MPLELIIAAVLVISLILYALLGGADFGGGMWDLLAFGPRARQQREAIADAIAPVWEANHVWLILVIVLLFTAYPAAFAAIMTALHIPITVVLVGIVLRGAAFIFRKYDAQDDATHHRWSLVFSIASFFTPLFLGMTLGGLASGAIRVTDGLVTTGFFAGWTTPFAIACGLFAQGMFAFLAATYMTVETQTDRSLQADFRWLIPSASGRPGLCVGPARRTRHLRWFDRLVGALVADGNQCGCANCTWRVMDLALSVGTHRRRSTGCLDFEWLGVGPISGVGDPRYYHSSRSRAPSDFRIFERDLTRRRVGAFPIIGLSLHRL